MSEDTTPFWWKLMNMDADLFSKRNNQWTMNNYSCLNKVAENLYVDVANDVKEFNKANVVDGQNQKDVKLGKKIASIPSHDYFLHPELQYDPKALRRYLEEHPECRIQRSTKSGNLASGPGFSLKPKP